MQGTNQLQNEHLASDSTQWLALMPVAAFTYNQHGHITGFNELALKLCKHAFENESQLTNWSAYLKQPDGKPFLAGQDPASITASNTRNIDGEELLYAPDDSTSYRLKWYTKARYNDQNTYLGGVGTLVETAIAPHNDEEKQALLAAIVDTSDDTILSKTLKGIITSWNKSAEQMFGYTADEVIGKHISILIPPSRLHEEDYIISNITQGKKIDHFETIRITKWGMEIPISLSVSPVLDSKGRVIGASKIAHNISLQKAAGNILKNYTQRLEIINSVSKIISEELDLNKILQKVTDVTTELIGARFGAFFYNTVNESGDAFMLYTLSGAPKEAFEKLGMPRHTSLFRPSFLGQGIIRIDDVTLDERYGQNHPNKGMPQGHLPVRSYMAIPVVSRSGRAIGALLYGHPEVGKFTEEHEALVIPIAAQAAVALDHAKLYEEVKGLNDKKDEFIGLASHELKTPLTSVTGYLQILNRMIDAEQPKKFVTKTIQQVKRLSALVSDLLDISKIEAGKLQLAEEHFDIHGVVTDAIELIHQSYRTHEIKLMADVESLQIYADPQRIEQVIINLLTNAIKYSPKANSVEVRLSQTGNEVQISVKDFGLGIPTEKRQQIFSRFYRVDDLSPNISGLGIGLYISHEIMSRHGGKLWVDSTLGQGSTFWMSLPIGDV